MSNSLLNRILKQAMITFSQNHNKGLMNLNSDPLFNQNIAEVRRLTSNLTSEDVFFEPHLILDRRKRAPVTYIGLFENQIATLGIFVLNDVFTMPLHDHPSMYGFVKVIFGKIRVRSYSEVKNRIPQSLSNIAKERGRRIISVEMTEEFEAHQDSPATMLTPCDGNFHSITSVDGPAAFLDLLSPPYDYRTGQRTCHYYSEISPRTSLGDDGDSLTNSNTRYLIEIDEPDEFFCDSVKYAGPPLSAE